MGVQEPRRPCDAGGPADREWPGETARIRASIPLMRDEHPHSSGEGSSGTGWQRQILEFVLTFALAFALVFGFIKPAVADSYRIPSSSMEPTLHGCEGCNNDRVMANKFIYRFTEPERGQIVVFRSVEDDDTLLIKRVIGIPGDRIQLRGGTLYVNGKPQVPAKDLRLRPRRGAQGAPVLDGR